VASTRGNGLDSLPGQGTCSKDGSWASTSGSRVITQLAIAVETPSIDPSFRIESEGMTRSCSNRRNYFTRQHSRGRDSDRGRAASGRTATELALNIVSPGINCAAAIQGESMSVSRSQGGNSLSSEGATSNENGRVSLSGGTVAKLPIVIEAPTIHLTSTGETTGVLTSSYDFGQLQPIIETRTFNLYTLPASKRTNCRINTRDSRSWLHISKLCLGILPIIIRDADWNVSDCSMHRNNNA